jgi:transposase
MKWIDGWDREQRHFLPECLEDYVRPDNPVRFLDAFVDSLDLRAEGFQFPKEHPQERGRPAYHPGDLLRLWLYGYCHQVRSSRRLQAQCQQNLEVIWLLKKLAPDFRTIADFRKDNAAAFKQVVRQFNRLCQELELFGGELIAIDGTKVKGQNSPGKNWSQTKLQKQAQELESRLEKYLAALEEADAQETQQAQPRPLSAEQLREKIDRLQHRQELNAQRQEQLARTQQSQYSQTDPESRSMKGAHGYVVGFNVQGAVDAKHHLLAVTEVTNEAVDKHQLLPMAQAAKAELQVEQLKAAADSGYYLSQGIKACQEQGIEVHVPEGVNSPSERAGCFGKGHFRYDPATDRYCCPAGQSLSRGSETRDHDRLLRHYYNRQSCPACPLRRYCTASPYRTVSRWEYEECLERMREQMAVQPEVLKRRKGLIEHCWAALKWLLSGGFLLKGLEKVRAEVSLAHFAYNLKRALRVVGLAGLMAGLRRRTAGASAN